ncbi:hypothetical protein [uncultured Thermus sp.]|uniref:PIN-like domain-containing protein n=1 Tax=uncultured Thermus sp. TaxID=157149 RepID=UPI00261C08E8|nr:hypothetical protein [uncultured Thermus sp.]
MSPTYFCDRNLGRKFPLRLRQLGLTVELHDDHFSQEERDEIWIPQVSRKQWIILTLDERIRFNKTEKEVLLAYRARVILLPNPKQQMPGWLVQVAQEFANAQARITRFINRTPPPFVARFRITEKKGKKRYHLKCLDL